MSTFDADDETVLNKTGAEMNGRIGLVPDHGFDAVAAPDVAADRDGRKRRVERRGDDRLGDAEIARVIGITHLIANAQPRGEIVLGL